MAKQLFLPGTKEQAWRRQGKRCGLCGEMIKQLGKAGGRNHKYGENAEAHHMTHIKQGGNNFLSNCVILCYSCHYSVHQGGNFRNRASYLITTSSDYPFFNLSS